MLGYIAAWRLGVWGVLSVPLIGVLIPLSIFLVMVSANVLADWSVFLCQKVGLLSQATEEDEDTDGASAWGVALRGTGGADEAPVQSEGCCASCCNALFPKSAAAFWGVQLRKPSKAPPRKKATRPAHMV